MFKKIALTTLVAAALVAGCKNEVKPPSRGRGDITDHRRIFFSQTYDQQLNDSTAILDEKISRSSTGQLTVVIPIRSAINRTQYLEYQYEFYDGMGKKVEGPMGWTAITLEAGSPGTIQFTSVSQVAEDYRVTIRYAR